MKHYEFEVGSFRYSLIGDCITIFGPDGVKLSHQFFGSYEIAKSEFLKLNDVLRG